MKPLFLIVFVVSAVLCYEKANYRSCSLEGDVDTIGTYTQWMTDCALTETNSTTCDQAFTVFQTVLNTTTLGVIADFSPFINFFNWKQWMQTNNRIPIFYANTGLCPDIVHRVSELSGVREITLEDQSGTRSVANHAWCDASHFISASGTCDNETIWGQVPNYISQANETFTYNGAAFYVPASEKFAQESFGVPRVLIRSFQRTYQNGSVGDVVAYNPYSVFGAYEMPTLFQNPDVTGINVLVVSNQYQPTETCNSGSVQSLQTTISGHYGSVVCLVDPPCVLNVVCNEGLEPPVNITNKETKCAYYNKLVELDSSYSANCNCTTGYLDDISSTVYDCPTINSDSDSSSVGKVEIQTLLLGLLVALLSVVM